MGERFIWYQEMASADRSQAERHGFVPLGSKSNVGIGEAYRQCLAHCTSEFALFLECDWVLTAADAERHLRSALGLLAYDSADLVRLRSRHRPGWPLNTIQIRGQESRHPDWVLESCYWTRRPDRLFPGEIRRVELGVETWYFARAANASWTNNPHLARTAFLRAAIDKSAVGEVDLEPAINAWWRSSGFVIAQGRGLFTHSRVDGPSARTGLRQRVALEIKRTIPAPIYRWVRMRGKGG